MTDGPGYVFLIGAPKSGTTSISRWLGEREDVAVVAGKEPRHFTDFAERPWTGPGSKGFLRNLIADRDAYEAAFAVTERTRWKLDASTDYLSCPASPDLLERFAEGRDVRVVAILRDPVERIVSEFQHTLRDGFQKGTLRRSLDREAERTARGFPPLFHHTARSRYAGPVEDYAARFGDRFLVLDYRSIGKDGPDGARARIAALLDLPPEPGPAPDVPRSNASHAPRSRVLMRALKSGPLHDVLRPVLPRPVRRAAWNAASRFNRTVYVPDPAEIAHARALLADDIAACAASPLVPTESWRTALPAG